MFESYKALVALKNTKKSITERRRSTVDENWTDPKNLKSAILYQKSLINSGKFDPIEYFGCEYMKDYNFYINNPKLDLAFKKDKNLPDPKDFGLESYFSPEKSEIETENTVDLGGEEILDQFSLTQNSCDDKINEIYGSLNKCQKVKTSSHQSMQSIKPENNRYCQLNNPKCLMNTQEKFKLTYKTYCDTGGSSSQKVKGPIQINLDDISGFVNKKPETTKYHSKKKVISKVKSNKSVKADKKVAQEHKIENPRRFPKKMAKSVLEKSCGSSRSPSPSNPHSSYYKQINMKMKEYSRKVEKQDSFLKLKGKNNSGKKATKHCKIELNNKKRPKIQNNESILSLNKSQRSLKNYTKLTKYSSKGNINYDSFLEYLNDTIKSSSTIESKTLRKCKKGHLGKKEQNKLKKSIDSAIMPSEKTFNRKKFTHIKNSNQSLKESVTKNIAKPKLEVNTALSGGGLGVFKPDYGISPYHPRTAKNGTKNKKNLCNISGNSKTRRIKGSSSKVSNSSSISKPCKKHTKKAEELSSTALCAKIKSDIKYFGSSKLSKYLKSCKERGTMKQPKKSPKANSNKKKGAIFGTRGGSIDVNQQMLSFCNFKNKIRMDLQQERSRKTSKNKNRSLERSLNRRIGSQYLKRGKS